MAFYLKIIYGDQYDKNKEVYKSQIQVIQTTR